MSRDAIEIAIILGCLGLIGLAFWWAYRKSS